MANDLIIQASALQGYSVILKRNQVSAKTLFQKAGINEEALTLSDTKLPVVRFAYLLKLTAETLEQPDFGMQLGSQQNFKALGALGQLIKNCKTVNEAMSMSQSFMSFHNQAEVWKCEVYGQTARLSRFDLLRNRLHDSQYAELAFATCIQLFKLILKGNMTGFELQFSHSRTSPTTSYTKHMGIPVTFNHEQDALVFPKTLLLKKLLLGDVNQFASAHEHVRGVQKSRQTSIYEQVNLLIQQVLSAGAPSIDFIAQLMNIHKRTLQRRLSHHGVTYKSLLSSVRMEKARWYLRCSNIDITMLAEMLGYQDPGNFSRAFKRVNGCSPCTFKMKQQPSR